MSAELDFMQPTRSGRRRVGELRLPTNDDGHRGLAADGPGELVQNTVI
jgi:hypothetical protein